MALIATAGAANANSYVTVAEATAFLHERLDTAAWYAGVSTSDLTLTEQREAALISATRLLDEQVQWYGRPATDTQALVWPQTGQVDDRGRTVDSTTIPTAVQRATAFYALALLQDVTETASTSTDTNVRRKRVGDTEIEYWQQTSTTSTTPATTMPAEVRQMLRPYGRISGGVNVPLVRA